MSTPTAAGGSWRQEDSRRNPRNWALARRLFAFLTVFQAFLVASRWGDWPVVSALCALFVFRVAANALLIAFKLRNADSVPALRLLYLLNLLTTTVECWLLQWNALAWFHVLFQSASLNGYTERESLSDFELRALLGGFLAGCAGLALHGGVAAQTIGLNCFAACFFYGVGEARCKLLYSSLKATRESHAQLLQVQAELVAKEKLSSLGLLAAGVAHEINNPMAFVKSNVWALHQDLAAQPQLPQALREYVDDVLPATLDGIRRVSSIVADLKRFTRNDSELPVRFDLNEEVSSALRLAQGELRGRGDLEVELGEVPPLVGQPRQICQVLLNLIVNAAQALPKQGGVVKVRTRMEGGEALFQVSDNGVGMSPEVQDHLFQPFFTTKPLGEGTGLGLAVAYSIVTQHKGRIDIDSAPGKGTRITVRLPGAREVPAVSRATG